MSVAVVEVVLLVVEVKVELVQHLVLEVLVELVLLQQLTEHQQVEPEAAEVAVVLTHPFVELEEAQQQVEDLVVQQELLEQLELLILEAVVVAPAVILENLVALAEKESL